MYKHNVDTHIVYVRANVALNIMLPQPAGVLCARSSRRDAGVRKDLNEANHEQIRSLS